jgi:hypothetical protein
MPAIMTAKPQAVPTLADPLIDSDTIPIFLSLLVIGSETIAFGIMV